MSTINFYTKLPYVENFDDITHQHLYQDVPVDWSVVVTDVRGSTRAIDQGRYKEVNFVAATSISAVLNINKYVELPFVFGGDGGTILIPNEHTEIAEHVLADTRTMAKEIFNLDLRVGIVPILDILKEKKKVRLLKYKTANDSIQPVIIGGGLEAAEELVKNNERYNISEDIIPKFKANYSGVKCVWRDEVAKSQESVSLLIKANEEHENSMQIYKSVITKINQIYGTQRERFPLKNPYLRLKFNMKRVQFDAKLKSYQSKREKFLIFLKHMAYDIAKDFEYAIRFLFGSKAKSQTMLSHIDSEKFDDMLRMVITGDELQRLELRNYLEKQYKKGYLAYGIHVSNKVSLTCLVNDFYGRKYHFIDGADGGYTFAAKEFKNKMKWLKLKTFGV